MKKWLWWTITFFPYIVPLTTHTSTFKTELHFRSVSKENYICIWDSLQFTFNYLFIEWHTGDIYIYIHIYRQPLYYFIKFLFSLWICCFQTPCIYIYIYWKSCTFFYVMVYDLNYIILVMNNINILDLFCFI